MTRIRQFAKDMGISYNKANSLVKKGRKTKISILNIEFGKN